MDTPLGPFAHAHVPGAVGIDYSFSGSFAPSYPIPESHAVVIDFEWGPTAAGPWTFSPDNVTTVPAGMTHFFATGVYHGPEEDPFVRIHFYAGGLMTVSGDYTHVSVVPEPSALLLFSLGIPALAWWRRRWSVLR